MPVHSFRLLETWPMLSAHPLPLENCRIIEVEDSCN